MSGWRLEKKGAMLGLSPIEIGKASAVCGSGSEGVARKTLEVKDCVSSARHEDPAVHPSRSQRTRCAFAICRNKLTRLTKKGLTPGVAADEEYARKNARESAENRDDSSSDGGDSVG